MWTGHTSGAIMCWNAAADGGASNGLPVTPLARLLGPGLSPRTGGPQPRSRLGHTPESVRSLLAVPAPPLPDQNGTATVLWAGFASGVVHAYEAVRKHTRPPSGVPRLLLTRSSPHGFQLLWLRPPLVGATYSG